MDKNTVLEKLKEIFKLVNPDFDVNNVSLSSRLKEDLNITSLSMIYIVVALENEFDIDMSDVSFNSFETVDDVVEYILEN